jgi:hypothetical protein
MKTSLLYSTVAALALGLASASAMAITNPSLLGETAAPDAAADRTIVLDSNTHYVNVARGDVVKFVSNGQEFLVQFDGTERTAMLSELAPSGALAKDVRVYVATSQYYGGM